MKVTGTVLFATSAVVVAAEGNAVIKISWLADLASRAMNTKQYDVSAFLEIGTAADNGLKGMHNMIDAFGGLSTVQKYTGDIIEVYGASFGDAMGKDDKEAWANTIEKAKDIANEAYQLIYQNYFQIVHVDAIDTLGPQLAAAEEISMRLMKDIQTVISELEIMIPPKKRMLRTSGTVEKAVESPRQLAEYSYSDLPYAQKIVCSHKTFLPELIKTMTAISDPDVIRVAIALEASFKTIKVASAQSIAALAHTLQQVLPIYDPIIQQWLPNMTALDASIQKMCTPGVDGVVEVVSEKESHIVFAKVNATMAYVENTLAVVVQNLKGLPKPIPSYELPAIYLVINAWNADAKGHSKPMMTALNDILSINPDVLKKLDPITKTITKIGVDARAAAVHADTIVTDFMNMGTKA